MSSGAIEAVRARLHFVHKEGSNNPRVYLDTDKKLLYISPSPPDKTGECYIPKRLPVVDLQTPHSETEDFLLPKHDKTRGCYQMQQNLEDDGRGG